MATSIHQQLKQLYADRYQGETEVSVGDYRVDVYCPDRLIEIQHASLSSLREKIRTLVKDHEVLVVKPLVFRRRLIKFASRGGAEISRRYSPKRGAWWEAFHELMYFRDVFPHERLTLELPAVEIEEHRFPKKKSRFRRPDYHIIDQHLVELLETRTLRERTDPLTLLPQPLPESFDTQDLAELWEIPRWVCQRITYFLRETCLIDIAGKRGRSILYRRAA